LCLTNGLGLPAADSDRATGGQTLMLELTEVQREDMTTLFELWRGRSVEPRLAARIVLDMIEPYSGSEPRLHFVNTVLSGVYSTDGALEMVATALRAQTDPGRAALLEIALASLHVRRAEGALAGRHWRNAETLSPAMAASSVVVAASVAHAEGRNEDVIALLGPSVASGHCHSGYHVNLARAQIALGRHVDAQHTLSRGIAAFPAADNLRRLAKQFGLDVET
jgi:hypothetical protein